MCEFYPVYPEVRRTPNGAGATTQQLYVTRERKVKNWEKEKKERAGKKIYLK